MKPYTKKKHPYRNDGYHLVFPSGRTWSCVDLSKTGQCIKGTSAEIVEDHRRTMEYVGKMYDTMGGRFEAMIVIKDDVDGEHQVRAHSFKELFEAVEDYDRQMGKHIYSH